MFRIYRCNVNEVDPRVVEVAKNYDAWEKELNSQLGASIVGSVALPKLDDDGQNISYYTNFRGEWDQVTVKNIDHYRSQFENGRKSLISVIDFLNSDKELNNRALESQRKDLADLINWSDKDYVINNNTIVSAACKASGYPESDYYKAKQRIINPEPEKVETKVVPPVPPIPPKKGGCLLPFLLGLLGLLLLLALLALLWWYFLRPWPFSQDPFAMTVEPQTTVVATEPVKEDPVPVASKPTLEDDENAVPTDEDKKALEQAKEEELRKAKEAEELKAKAEAQAKAKAEAEAKAKAEAERKAKEEVLKKAKAEAERKALEAKKNKIPKCKTLKEQGTMPQMAIAFDGSESMTIPYGSTSRLGAAKNAAVNLINATDKNVSIGLVEVNGCPAAKNRGFFSGSARNSLISNVNSIDPYRYDGKTPLVNGLNQLATMLDGVNAEAVGILISDGEDTCPFTSNMNLCNVAANIHRAKPKLTIHTILIGDSIDSAACVANITGGKVFKPRDALQIQQFIKEAGAKLKKVCE